MATKALEIKKGNAAAIEILCYDNSGTALTDLSSTTEITFQVREERDDTSTAIIEKTKTAGAITVNDPSSGYITIALVPADTSSLTVKKYYFAVELTYSATVKYELNVYVDNIKTDIFDLVQDVVR